VRKVPDGLGVHRNLAGWKRDLPHFGDAIMAMPDIAMQPAAELPLMQQVPVYDQGQLGSCTANMGSAMFRYLEVKAGKAPLNVSRMSLYKYTRQFEGTPLTEDSGAQIRDVFKAMHQYGVAMEEDDPYIDDGRQFTLPPTPIEDLDAVEHEALFYYRCLDLNTIKASILQGFPVGGGFSVYSYMMSRQMAMTGELQMPANGDTQQGGHAITFFGFDDTKKIFPSSAGSLLVRNSWGTGWGYLNSGNFYMPYEMVTSGLASDFWTLRSARL